MALSDYEREVLEGLERQLRDDASQDTVESGASRKSALEFEAKRVAFGGLGVFLGVLILLSGVYAQKVWLGLVGVILMFLSAIYMIGRGKSSPIVKKSPFVRNFGSNADTRSSESKARTKGSERNTTTFGQSSFMDEQARKWDERGRNS